MRGRWQPSGWVSWWAGSSADTWTQRGSRMDDGRAGTRPPMVTGRENSVIITARACLVPLRPTGAGPKSHFVVFDCFDGTLLEYFRKSTGMTVDPPEADGK